MHTKAIYTHGYPVPRKTHGIHVLQACIYSTIPSKRQTFAFSGWRCEDALTLRRARTSVVALGRCVRCGDVAGDALVGGVSVSAAQLRQKRRGGGRGRRSGLLGRTAPHRTDAAIYLSKTNGELGTVATPTKLVGLAFTKRSSIVVERRTCCCLVVGTKGVPPRRYTSMADINGFINAPLHPRHKGYKSNFIQYRDRAWVVRSSQHLTHAPPPPPIQNVVSFRNSPPNSSSNNNNGKNIVRGVFSWCMLDEVAMCAWLLVYCCISIYLYLGERFVGRSAKKQSSRVPLQRSIQNNNVDANFCLVLG